MKPLIKVLIVEDSATIREFLRHLLSADPALEVVGTAANGEDAVAAVLALNPDAITMDINMPRVDGLEATRRIMETRPTPIIIVSALIPAEQAASFQAMEAGALAVLPRPVGFGHADYEPMARELVRTVKTMAEVKLVKRHPRHPAVGPPQPSLPGDTHIQLVVMGGSTGAPEVFDRILKRLPKDLPFPMVLVQHITAGFIGAFAEWLSESVQLPVKVAQAGEKVEPGRVYLAPDGCHTCVTSAGVVVLSQDPPEHGLRPAICTLFRSAAYSFADRAAGVLLSGMGLDGAEGLKLMRDRGALTIVQAPETALISSMPGEALRRGAARYVLAPEEISGLLGQLAERHAANPEFGEVC